MAITKIAQVDVGAGGAATISFSSIPNTFTDLQIVFSLRSDRAGIGPYDNIGLRLNGDTATNYATRVLLGDGAAVGTSSYTASTQVFGWGVAADATANTFGNGVAYIPNYAGSTAKSVSIDTVGENNAAASPQDIGAGIWTGTAAINAVLLRPQNGNFAQYSSATLYGILKGTSGGVTVA